MVSVSMMSFDMFFAINIPKDFLFVVVKVLKRSSTKSTGRNTFSLNVVAKKSEYLRVR